MSRLKVPSLILLFSGAAALYLFSAHFRAAGFEPDDGLYMVIAKSIHQGSGYRVLSLPGSPPQIQCPPLFPLALSFCWDINPFFPENIHLMRTFSAICALLAVFLAYIYIRLKSDYNFIIILLFLIALIFNPFFAFYSGQIMSEMLFTLLSLVSIILFIRYERGKTGADLYGALFFAALALYTRSIGLALFAAFITRFLSRRRFKAALLSLFILLVVWSPWLCWLYSQSLSASGSHAAAPPPSYFEGIFSSADHIIKSLPLNTLLRLLQIASLLCPLAHIERGLPLPAAVSAFIFTFICLFFFLKGIIYEVGKSLSVDTCYILATLLILFLWLSWSQERYLVPLLPFILFHLIQGVKSVKEDLESVSYSRIAIPLWSLGAGILFFGVIVLSSNIHSAVAFMEERKYQNDEAQFKLMERACTWLRNNTQSEDIAASRFDCLAYLLSERKSVQVASWNMLATRNAKSIESMINTICDDEKIIRAINDLNVDYILIFNPSSAVFDSLYEGRRRALYRIINRYPEAFLLCHKEEGAFFIYEVKRERLFGQTGGG